MLELVIDQRRRNLGGFEVGRVLPMMIASSSMAHVLPDAGWERFGLLTLARC